MALLKSAKQLELLIPEPNEKYFMSKMTHVPQHIINENPLFAIVVSGITNRVINLYKVIFTLFSSGNSYYLFIGNEKEELNTSSYFISAKTEENEKLNINHWGFEVDDIGLHVTTHSLARDIIYFSNSIVDADELRNKLGSFSCAKKELVAETVYV